jgi:hypothetical protein
VHSTLGRPSKNAQAALAFADEIAATVPVHQSIFASPELHSTDLIVFAYRLGRQIDRKPVACVDGNGYFLMPVESLSLARFEMKVLAFSKINELALVSVLRPQDASAKNQILRRVSCQIPSRQKTLYRPVRGVNGSRTIE